MVHDNKNTQKHLTEEKSGSNLGLTDFDICELYIKCTSVFVETSSKMDISRETSFELGRKLWRETIKTLEEYRKDKP